LANIKSAKKRIKVIAAKTLKNKMFKTSMKTAIKRYESALTAGDKTAAAATYKAVVKKIDMAASKGILHKNTAARKKSSFTKKFNALGA
jgi:ribosomal protein S20